VRVTFDRGQPRTFDLVVGADGLHSNVRAPAFGTESRFIRDLGHYVAIFTTPNHMNLDHTGRFYNVPGKTAGMYSARDNTEAKAMFLFASPPLDYDRRDIDQQKKILAGTFAGQHWEVPTLIKAMWDAPDLLLRLGQPDPHRQLVAGAGGAARGCWLRGHHGRHGHGSGRGERLRAGRGAGRRRR
jgi:2-polyprenyl-6-methoxyphenol hydroxylase-like FAD-dependent oxidoreductase